MNKALLDKEAWCRGPDCKFHPLNKIFKRRAILNCLMCKLFVQKQLYSK